MSLWGWLASKAGDTQISTRIAAIWPWPAVTVGFHKRKFSALDYRHFTSHILPGDFLLAREDGYFLSNNAIPGALKHLAVYTGPIRGLRDPRSGYIESPYSLGARTPHTGIVPRNIYERSVTHAISDGVVTVDLIEFLFHTDYCLAVRAWENLAQQQAIVRAALSHVGKPYDFNFDQTSDTRLFCTELGLECVRAATLPLPSTQFKRLSLFKRPVEVTVADSFLRYKAVACSESCNDPWFVDQSDTPALLNDAIVSLRSSV